jgi:hypothetical protein
VDSRRRRCRPRVLAVSTATLFETIWLTYFHSLTPEKVPYEIKARGSLETIRHGQTKDVFLYNPRAKTAANGEVRLSTSSLCHDSPSS